MRSFLEFLFIKSTLVHTSGHWYCLHLNLVTWGKRLRNEELRDPEAWGAVRGSLQTLGTKGTRAASGTQPVSYAFVLGPLRYLTEGRNDVLSQFFLVDLDQNCL